MPARPPALNEPVVVAKFWKNRQHDAIITSLTTYEGRNLVDVRMHRMDQKTGRLVPTQNGISIVVLRLPELADAVNKALSKAKELRLLQDDGASE
jgi:hypothetical protein